MLGEPCRLRCQWRRPPNSDLHRAADSGRLPIMAAGGEALLRVDEVARLARVSTKTVYRAIKSGRLRAYRVGSQLRIPESAVWAWLELEAA